MVSGEKEPVSKDTIAKNIKNGEHYYVKKEQNEVIAVNKNSSTYIRTKPDNTIKDNLSHLNEKNKKNIFLFFSSIMTLIIIGACILLGILFFCSNGKKLSIETFDSSSASKIDMPQNLIGSKTYVAK
ncbi:MAG: DUF3892 domain-containing protein, partial [Mycoplasmataceae bacterium]|nr:DUF3892 domain-containing protein [Mycoplasmataceae bacterium]